MTIPLAKASFPEMYEQALVGPLFRPFAELLLDQAKPGGNALALVGMSAASRDGFTYGLSATLATARA